MKRTPLVRKTPLSGGGALPRKRATPRRRKADPRPATTRRSPDHGMPYPEARRVVFGRSGGRCEAAGCGAPLGDRMEVHHRLTRRLGPDCPCNLLALCSRCHHDRVHGSPEWAREHGLIVSRHSLEPPAAVVVETYRGRLLLDCAGNFARVA